ncbi:MAG: SMP-30/gluconolactonase/LRE family protein [Bryobacterales bacterium]|nr:SMP-30/gluconolactonase/LRE family protein [Bryobacterales bacterium]
MIRRSTALALVFLTPIWAQEELPAPSGETIVAPDARFEVLYTRPETAKGGLTEGPAVAPDGSIYFSDILRGENHGRIHRFAPESRKVEMFAANSHKANGLVFGPEGDLFAAEGADYGGRRISRWDVKTKERTVVVDGYGGKRFNSPNDVAIDSRGNLYFTDPRYVGHEPRELEDRAVYRVTRTGELTEVTRDVTKPNGLVLSPDDTTLYVAETNNGSDGIPGVEPGNRGPMKIYAFVLGENGLVSGPRRVFLDFGSQFGCDGMTVDEQGNLYLTIREPSKPGVLVLDPDGDQVGFLPTGVGVHDEEVPFTEAETKQLETPPAIASGLPSNVEFGKGEDSNLLYVTVDQSLYRIRLLTRGYHRQYRD